MSQKFHGTKLIVAALAALLVDSLAGGSGLVLCSASDGHRAIEFEHNATGCPTLTSSTGVTSASAQPDGACIDVPSVGTSLMTAPSFDAARLQIPPVTFVAPVHEPTLRIEARFSASSGARAGPRDLAPHLHSTVLLV